MPRGLLDASYPEPMTGSDLKPAKPDPRTCQAYLGPATPPPEPATNDKHVALRGADVANTKLDPRTCHTYLGPTMLPPEPVTND
nr:hypothetical protein [Tanacetum cinerariifolium]